MNTPKTEHKVPTGERIKVIVVDDHQIIRDGIEAMLLTCRNIELIGAASGFDELCNLLDQRVPDVLILDLALPGKTGLEIIQELRPKQGTMKILILSANADENNVIRSIQAGAKGFLPKDTSKEELILAIERIVEGEEYFGNQLSKIIYKSYAQYVQMHRNAEPGLSERETDVIKLLSEGLSSKEIGNQLHISSRTVETHKAHILEKLELKNTADLIKYAIKQGIISL
ncbi:MAG TPA: response regulator transcription factor [Prolixibacteraceae bacterium]|nr:response regulator transcription factor [Prolixibacteraceae bacterium]